MSYLSKYHIMGDNNWAGYACNLVVDTSWEAVHMGYTSVAGYFFSIIPDTISKTETTLSLLSFAIKSFFLFIKVIDEALL